MKKTIGKTVLFIFCVGVVVFLLLPFLQTESAQSAAVAEGEKPTPQIFTSNPLTSIVKKLASLFRKNEKQAEQPQQVALSNEQVNEKFGVPQYRGASENGDDPDLIASAGNNTAVNSSGYGEGEDESWVLIPQTSPENSTPGMHEINIKDNAYDNYVREQKAASYNPALRTNVQNVPYWKKLLNPITKFFGSSDGQQVAAGKWNKADPLGKGGDLSAGGNLTGNSNVVAGNVQRMKPLDLSARPNTLANAATLFPPSKEEIRQSARRAFDLLTQESSFERTAEMWAAAKNSHPDQQGQREADKIRKVQEFKQAFSNALQTKMDELKANAQDIPAQDNLNAILDGDCSSSSLPKQSSSCAETETPGNSTKEDILAAQRENADLFASQTGYPPIKNLPITPVLGIADLPDFEPQPIEDPDLTGLSPEQQAEMLRRAEEAKQREQQREAGFIITKFLYEQNGCSSEHPCAWVANGIQNSPDLKESVEKAGQLFVGDPAGIYTANEKAYVAYRLQSVPEEQRAQMEKQAREEYQKAAPAMIPYNADQASGSLKNSIQNLKNGQGDISVFHIRNSGQASDFAGILGSHLFFFSQNNDGMQENSSKEGKAVTSDLAQDANFYLETSEQIVKPANEETVHLLLQKGIEDINSASNNGKNTFVNIHDWSKQQFQQMKSK